MGTVLPELLPLIVDAYCRYSGYTVKKIAYL